MSIQSKYTEHGCATLSVSIILCCPTHLSLFLLPSMRHLFNNLPTNLFYITSQPLASLVKYMTQPSSVPFRMLQHHSLLTTSHTSPLSHYVSLNNPAVTSFILNASESSS